MAHDEPSEWCDQPVGLLALNLSIMKRSNRQYRVSVARPPASSTLSTIISCCFADDRQWHTFETYSLLRSSAYSGLCDGTSCSHRQTSAMFMSIDRRCRTGKISIEGMAREVIMLVLVLAT